MRYLILIVLGAVLFNGCATHSDGIGLGWREHSAYKDYSVQTVTDVVRAGKKAVRFEIRKGDHWYGSGPYREGPHQFRTELSGYSKFKATMGKDYWYGFSMLIPIDFPPVPQRQLIIGQWHGVGDPDEGGRSPVLAQRYEGHIFKVRLLYHPGRIQTYDSGTKVDIYVDPDFTKGVWHDFVYHVKWSYKDDGFVDMWLDGKKVAAYKGPVGYNDIKGPYFKYGMYFIPYVLETYVIYFDEYRRGKSYEEVDPAGNHYKD